MEPVQQEQVLCRGFWRYCFICLSHTEACWGEAHRLEIRFSQVCVWGGGARAWGWGER